MHAHVSAMRIQRARVTGPDAIAPPGYRQGVREIGIRGDMIRLGQLLKLADLASGGGDVKAILADGVTVNGQPEDRRGRQLHPGDVVGAAGDELRVVAQA